MAAPGERWGGGAPFRKPVGASGETSENEVSAETANGMLRQTRTGRPLLSSLLLPLLAPSPPGQRARGPTNRTLSAFAAVLHLLNARV